MKTWAKRIGLGLAAIVTAAGAQLVTTCAGQSSGCWERAWVGALVTGAVRTVWSDSQIPSAPTTNGNPPEVTP